MSSLVIKGGERLVGSVKTNGAKNAALALLPASILAEGTTVIDNLPAISDVADMASILSDLGATIKWRGPNELEITSATDPEVHPPDELVKKMRASYYFMGALLAKVGEAHVALPGGDNIGQRPIDQHLKGFQALGAKTETQHGIVSVWAHELKGAHIYFDVVSVGATINVMLAASMAKGLTILENVAKEPEIVDVANFLNAMGARVKGAGTDTIKIHGVDCLEGCNHSVIPDRIEAGTFMVAAAVTRGDITVENVIPKHLEALMAKLRETGADVVEEDDTVRVRMIDRPQAVDIKTLPYPGFPTDLQAQVMALLCHCNGTSVISEGIFERRFSHAEELNRMGADIRVEGRAAIIEGVKQLTGATVCASDIRAGAALVLAGLSAEGETVVHGVDHIDRGFEHIEDKLRHLGGKIRRM